MNSIYWINISLKRLAGNSENEKKHHSELLNILVKELGCKGNISLNESK